MTGHYINVIADALADYDKNQRSYQFYEDISWERLSEIKDKNGNNSIIYTEAWKKLSLTEKQNIL